MEENFNPGNLIPKIVDVLKIESNTVKLFNNFFGATPAGLSHACEFMIQSPGMEKRVMVLKNSNGKTDPRKEVSYGSFGITSLQPVAKLELDSDEFNLYDIPLDAINLGRLDLRTFEGDLQAQFALSAKNEVEEFVKQNDLLEPTDSSLHDNFIISLADKRILFIEP